MLLLKWINWPISDIRAYKPKLYFIHFCEIFEGYLLPQSTAMGSYNHQKKLQAPLHPETLFWDDAHAQIRSKLIPLNSNLRDCIATYVALENTIGPSRSTQRPTNSILKACIATRVALENIIGPHTTVPLIDLWTAPWASKSPQVVLETTIWPHTTSTT